MISRLLDMMDLYPMRKDPKNSSWAKKQQKDLQYLVLSIYK